MDVNAKVIPFHLQPLGFIEAFTTFGADLNALLAGAGIPPHVLKTPREKISYAQQTALIQTGVELCRKPGLGLLVGAHFDWLFFGTVGAVIHCSPTIRITPTAATNTTSHVPACWGLPPRRLTWRSTGRITRSVTDRMVRPAQLKGGILRVRTSHEPTAAMTATMNRAKTE